jgi:hypothetical protein
MLAVALPAAHVRQVGNLLRIAGRATDCAIRPSHLKHEAPAILIVFEINNRVSKRPWVSRYHASNLANEAWFVKYVNADASLKDPILARDVDTSRELYENVLKRMNEIGVAAEKVYGDELVQGTVNSAR